MLYALISSFSNSPYIIPKTYLVCACTMNASYIRIPSKAVKKLGTPLYSGSEVEQLEYG